jgi:hypothetical protein
VVDPGTPGPNPETTPSKTEVVVKYRDHAGELTERTFSKDVHGPDFAKLDKDTSA